MAQQRGNRRKLQAQQTRGDIIQGARRLFATKGYAGTSMADIAAEAGVVIQTIYSSVGPKQAILRELNDLIDEEAGVAEIVVALAATEDQREMLRLAVRLTRQVVERCGDIVAGVHAAAGTEPEMAAILEEGRRRHREGLRGVAEALAASGALPNGLTAAEASRSIAVLSSNEVYFQLTRDFGMSFAAAERWILSTLELIVLGPEQEMRSE